MNKNHYPRIQELRISHGRSTEELALLLKIHVRTYRHYETGQTLIPPHDLSMLADYYGVSTDYLLGRTNSKTPHRKPPKKQKEERP